MIYVLIITFTFYIILMIIKTNLYNTMVNLSIRLAILNTKINYVLNYVLIVLIFLSKICYYMWHLNY